MSVKSLNLLTRAVDGAVLDVSSQETLGSRCLVNIRRGLV